MFRNEVGTGTPTPVRACVRVCVPLAEAHARLMFRNEVGIGIPHTRACGTRVCVCVCVCVCAFAHAAL